MKSQSGLKEVYTMRKCEKCGANMKSDLRLKVNGGGYGICQVVFAHGVLLLESFGWSDCHLDLSMLAQSFIHVTALSHLDNENFGVKKQEAPSR